MWKKFSASESQVKRAPGWVVEFETLLRPVMLPLVTVNGERLTATLSLMCKRKWPWCCWAGQAVTEGIVHCLRTLVENENWPLALPIAAHLLSEWKAARLYHFHSGALTWRFCLTKDQPWKSLSVIVAFLSKVQTDLYTCLCCSIWSGRVFIWYVWKLVITLIASALQKVQYSSLIFSHSPPLLTIF